MARFFVELDLEVNQELELPIEVVRHINVLRIRLTDTITLFNNDGCDYTAQLLVLEKRQIICKIINKIPIDIQGSQVKIHLLMAMIANDKFDLVLQKSVELGVDEFTPLITQNTQRINKEKFSSKQEHWHRIIISASEQCGRAKLMKLNTPQEFKHIIKENISGTKFILSPHHSGKLNQYKDITSNTTLIIGPEGGLTTEEVELANKNDYHSILLGNRILRAETAAIATISILQYQIGDF
ncbi:MAG: 16S rRNA (uracil(1498)-N(3))-methyltransferase [Burkholderiales bacterium]|nr:16S rRNA (uracil(1498)-N(3))-methyltransferase [Burkholderiales bacterium]